MNYLPYSTIRDKVQADLDLQDEEMILPEEMRGYANDAIREAEAEILGIYEDYFLNAAPVSLVSGQDLYSLPATIYATKIRGIMYQNGNTIYPVKRIRDWKKFLDLALSDYFTNSTEDYRYIIINSSAASGVQMKLVPPSRETTANVMNIWFIREANRIVTDADVCDIPEFESFIYAHMKVSCRKKEFNGFCPQEDTDKLNEERARMISTLTAMVPDTDTEIEKDMSLYYDMFDTRF